MISARTGTATRKIIAQRVSTVKAAITAPITINGDRKKRRKNWFTPDSARFISPVILVISDAAPILSRRFIERLFIFLNISRRTAVPNPYAALAAKYCAVTALISPNTPISTKSPHIRSIYPLSPFAIPTSIIFAIIIGTVSSKHASSILKSGPNIHCFVYPLRYFKRLSIKLFTS